MKKRATILAAALALTVPFTGMTAEHSHGTMHHGGEMMAGGQVAHEEVINGVRATFEVLDMRAQMKGDMPKGMMETHHVMVRFTDAASGGKITSGEVKVKILGPDKAEQTKDLKGMQGHFGADFDLSKRGRYGVMCKFQLKDGKVRSTRFWYIIK